MHLVRNGQCQVQYASTYSIIIFLSGLFICRNCRIPARYIYDTSYIIYYLSLTRRDMTATIKLLYLTIITLLLYWWVGPMSVQKTSAAVPVAFLSMITDGWTILTACKRIANHYIAICQYCVLWIWPKLQLG